MVQIKASAGARRSKACAAAGKRATSAATAEEVRAAPATVASGAALAGALSASPAMALTSMPSPAGTMDGALPALATILFVFIPVAFLIILYVKTSGSESA